MNIYYPALFNYDHIEKRHTVIFPDLPEASTEAETLNEAHFNAIEVLTLTLEGRINEKMVIPQPSSLPNAQLIAPLAKVQSALLAYWANTRNS